MGLALFALQSSLRAQGDLHIVDTPNAVLRLAPISGDLVGLKWKDPKLEIIHEPRLGENFRILLPKPGHEACYFDSRDQKAHSIDERPDGVVCQYDSLRNEEEQVPVKVRYQIHSIGRQIQFSIEVENPTDRKIAEVFYGILGGQQGIQQRIETESLIPGGYGYQNLAPHLFSQFSGGAQGGGNLGVRYDVAGYNYPGAMSMGWMDVFNRKADVGYYYGNQDPETRIACLYTELHPYAKAMAPKDNWPSPANLPPGEPVGLTLGWVNFPYTAKGIFRGGPLALQVHTGDWHSGSAIYRLWFDQHFTVARENDWLRKEMAWQSVIISNPEDVIVHRFNALPKLAADAKKYGVTTFEILGWNVGGIDRGYPNYQPDPRLGSAEEFRTALADIRALGVHPLLFANVQVADTGTAAFRTELSQYAVEGRWAPDWEIAGWGEGTISARLGGLGFGTVRKNMAIMSPSHPEFRELLIEQFIQRVKDGAEGFQLDKTVLDGVLDFNPRLTVSPDRSLTQGVLTTFSELLRRARKINPSVALASENQYDRAFQYVDVSYLRMWDRDADSTALRYTFPEWTSTIFGEGPDDFGPMNNGLRYGLVWALAPRHYNDSMDELLTRPLSRYVRELIRIRQKYSSLLFFGRFEDTLGAEVVGDEDIRYSVFRPMDAKAAGQACVIVNFGDHEESANIDFPGFADKNVEISLPFKIDRQAQLPLHLTLPPNTSAVVVSHAE